MPIPPMTPATPAPDKAHRDLKKACQQFDGYFTDLLFKEMRKTVPDSKLLGDQSNQRQIFTDMMDQTLADSMAQRPGPSLGQMMYDQLAPALGPPAAPKDKGEPRR